MPECEGATGKELRRLFLPVTLLELDMTLSRGIQIWNFLFLWTRVRALAAAWFWSMVWPLPVAQLGLVHSLLPHPFVSCMKHLLIRVSY